ncbi:hypothetical protein GCM10023405_35630 [Streptomonospora salina]
MSDRPPLRGRGRRQARSGPPLWQGDAMDDMRDALLVKFDAACTTTCHYCPCPLPPETVRCRLCGRLQERGAAPDGERELGQA